MKNQILFTWFALAYKYHSQNEQVLKNKINNSIIKLEIFVHLIGV